MTSDKLAPSAARTDSILLITSSVCSSIDAPESLPVLASTGPVPVTKMKSPARQPCEYAPCGAAPLVVWITYFDMIPPLPSESRF